jgi:hypothetical protein
MSDRECDIRVDAKSILQAFPVRILTDSIVEERGSLEM